MTDPKYNATGKFSIDIPVTEPGTHKDEREPSNQMLQVILGISIPAVVAILVIMVFIKRRRKTTMREVGDESTLSKDWHDDIEGTEE